MDLRKERMKSAFKQFVLDKVHVTFDTGVFDPVIDDIEKRTDAMEITFKIDIPFETIQALQKLLKENK